MWLGYDVRVELRGNRWGKSYHPIRSQELSGIREPCRQYGFRESCSVFGEQRVSFDEQYPEATVIMGAVLRVRVWKAGLTAGIKAPGGVPKLQEPCCDPRYWVWGTPSGTPLFRTPLKASVFNHLENKYKV